MALSNSPDQASANNDKLNVISVFRKKNIPFILMLCIINFVLAEESTFIKVMIRYFPLLPKIILLYLCTFRLHY